MSADSTSYADSWYDETEPLTAARKRGEELGIPSPSRTTAAALALLASAVRAKTVVEVGTGVGVTGLQLLDGMVDGGILTTIDADASGQAAAKQAFRDAGIDSTKARQITGNPIEILPRLADGSYDMVAVNALGDDPMFYLDQAQRLLREGGVLVLSGILGTGNTVTDPAVRDAQTLALRKTAQAVKEDAELIELLLPLDTGLIIASKR